MRSKIVRGIQLGLLVGLCMTGYKTDVFAAGVNAGISNTLAEYMQLADLEIQNKQLAMTQSGAAADGTICGYRNLGIANVETNLNIRDSADENGNLVGKLPKDAACEIITEKDGWCQIQSGKATGYVKAEFLLTGEEAKAKADDIMSTVATVTTITLNVRAEQNTDCEIVAQMPEGEELEVVEEYEEWVKVDVDGETGYVNKGYIDISVQLPKAVTMKELKNGDGYSDTRVSLVTYATQFVGNPYVWGGTSLTKGADCSGFVMSVFAKYGVYLPHSSRAQAGCGTKVSSSDAKPGDLFFYGSGKSINHVAIYIGNGQVVHASSPSTGIKISNAFYRTPIKVVRVLSD